MGQGGYLLLDFNLQCDIYIVQEVSVNFACSLIL